MGRQRSANDSQLIAQLMGNNEIVGSRQSRLQRLTILVRLLALSILIQLSQSTIVNNQFQIIRKLNPLRTYKDAQFFRFQIPPETSIATFRLNASQSDSAINITNLNLWNASHPLVSPPTTTMLPTTTSKKPQFPYFNTTVLTVYSEKAIKFYNSLLSTACKKPLDVVFYLRWGSLPLVSIKNATIPDKYVFDNVTEQYRIELQTDGKLVLFNLTNPLPGDWYGMAYINHSNDKITQKGLERECYYSLVSILSLDPFASKNVTMLTPSATSSLKQSLIIDQQSSGPFELFYKFFAGNKEYGAKIVISNCQFKSPSNLRHHPIQTYSPSPVSDQTMNATSMFSLANGSCPLEISFRSLALPSETKREFTFNCQSSNLLSSNDVQADKCIIDLPTYAPNQWNYFRVKPLVNNNEKNVIESRAKLIIGSINFTIQVLVGEEAFLYKYYLNNQQCQTSASFSSSYNTASTTFNPLHYHPNNYGSNVNMFFDNKFIPTASYSEVAPPKINSILSNQNENNLLSVNSNFGLNSANNKDAFHPQSPSEKPVLSGTEESGDYEESVGITPTEKSLVSSNLINKRSADQGKDRKKSDQKKEERRLKKQKNKNKQKNKDKSSNHCQFDPQKILATLDDDDLSNMTFFNTVNLTRYQAFENFEFRYGNLNASDLPNYLNFSAAVMFDIENDRPSLLNFTIMPQFDIGGSLVIDFAINPQTNHSHENISAILCITYNRLPPVLPLTSNVRFEDFCYGHLITNTSGNFDKDGVIETLVVPYPQPGTWFISITTRCYTEEEFIEDPNLVPTDHSSNCDYINKTSVLLDIRSSACYNSRCLNGGKCLQYLSGGILYSTCSCRAGWKGWICNDGSEALSEEKLLINFLLLTLSNGAFIPAIIVAACRHYFTESAIYLITMFSSALYHACDSDYSQSYCVLSVGLLQFADFYTAILSFFVTLITLAHLSPGCKSFLHLLGAILIALITQNDRTNLWTFVIPAGIGTLLLFICWCTHCCRKSCYPPARCWIFSVCPAFLLTTAGLIIYAFFETQENYAITHSVWHTIMALALLFAIPSMPPIKPPESEEEDDERVHFMSSSSSSGAGSGKGTAKSNPETYYELIGEEASHLARSHPQGVPANTQHITKTY